MPDLFILQTAGQWATTNAKHRSLHTRSLHTELVFSLSGSKHVRQAQAAPAGTQGNMRLAEPCTCCVDWGVLEAIRRQ